MGQWFAGLPASFVLEAICFEASRVSGAEIIAMLKPFSHRLAVGGSHYASLYGASFNDVAFAPGEMTQIAEIICPGVSKVDFL